MVTGRFHFMCSFLQVCSYAFLPLGFTLPVQVILNYFHFWTSPAVLRGHLICRPLPNLNSNFLMYGCYKISHSPWYELSWLVQRRPCNLLSRKLKADGLFSAAHCSPLSRDVQTSLLAPFSRLRQSFYCCWLHLPKRTLWTDSSFFLILGLLWSVSLEIELLAIYIFVHRDHLNQSLKTFARSSAWPREEPLHKRNKKMAETASTL